MLACSSLLIFAIFHFFSPEPDCASVDASFFFFLDTSTATTVATSGEDGGFFLPWWSTDHKFEMSSDASFLLCVG